MFHCKLIACVCVYTLSMCVHWTTLHYPCVYTGQHYIIHVCTLDNITLSMCVHWTTLHYPCVYTGQHYIIHVCTLDNITLSMCVHWTTLHCYHTTHVYSYNMLYMFSEVLYLELCFLVCVCSIRVFYCVLLNA